MCVRARSFNIPRALTKQSVAEADGHRLGLGVVRERSFAKLSPDARLLVSTEGELVVQHVVLVDPDGTGAEAVGNADGGVEVGGVDGSGETVIRVVGALEDLLLRLELGDRADRAEDLLLDDLHVLGDVGEDSWLDKVSLVAVTLTTSLNGCTSLLSFLDVAHDAVVLELGDLRTLEGIRGEWVTNLVGSGTSLESLNEVVVDTGLDEDTRAGAAALAVVVENAKVDPGDGVVDIGIVENNVRGLATELESDLLQVG